MRYSQLLLAFALAIASTLPPAEAHKTDDPWTTEFGNLPDLAFSGFTTFAHLPGRKCLDHPDSALDIAVLGVPFDSAVSFRPGARFGPYGLRSGSRRQRHERAWGQPLQINPYDSGLDVIDCGDIPVTPFDPATAIRQINAAYRSMLARPVLNSAKMDDLGMQRGLDGEFHPRVVALGGDHTIVLPILDALHSVYGPVSVLHFDAHIDTWNPKRYSGSVSLQSELNHGTFFWHAYENGFIKGNSSIHAGIRTRFSGPEDLDDDITAGFDLIHTFDIDDHGVDWIADKIKARIGSNPVVISLDVDVMDPSYVPATGTPESGGWTSRELRRIIHSLVGLNIVGVDVVELAPAYDTNAEISAIAAADMIFDFMSLLALGVDRKGGSGSASEIDSGRGGETEQEVLGRTVDEL
ncbi:putative arginase [Naematelia encephala]|uniref:Putative arginase n=1 Tax=Naematelia encephala TaxID=71784 RepID=A0A1Y2ASH9_9TREE|nr:putative arginase [Naematelia encephala]